MFTHWDQLIKRLPRKAEVSLISDMLETSYIEIATSKPQAGDFYVLEKTADVLQRSEMLVKVTTLASTGSRFWPW